jgi:hypothetical protein
MDAQVFAQWLLEVGHGQNMNTNSQVRFPDHMQVDNSDSLIASIYPGIDSIPPLPPDYFLNRMILAPRNADVGDMNQKILACMSGDIHQYVSANEIIQEAGADPLDDDPIPNEFLHSVHSSSLPLGKLNLKIGCSVILLQNLAPSQGLCNGTHMVITQMHDRVLEVQLIGGEHDGEIALIPQVSLFPSASSADVTFRFKWQQFPV